MIWVLVHYFQTLTISGSVGGVHVNCLENWLNVRNIGKCEVCNGEYAIRRILKYGKLRSIFPFIRTHGGQVLYHVFCICIMSAAVVLANYVIPLIRKILQRGSLSLFSQLYFTVVLIFLYYFFLLECFYEIYHVFVSWRGWRTSVYTIQVI